MINQIRQNPIVKLFASIRFGVLMLALILVYASLGSALPQIRGAVEMSEMDIFRHWIFTALIVLFTISLITATLVRIRFKVVNLGVLTVHTGLLLLVAGSLYYFGTKIEGDVRLQTPAIDLVSIQGKNSRVIARIPAEKGESWSNLMPAFGGQVSLTVEGITKGSNGVPARASVRFQAGASDARIISAENGQLTQTSDDGRLAVRLTADGPTDEFYDDETPALYVTPAGGVSDVIPIQGLPLFRERYTDEGYVLKDAADHEIPSKRVKTEANLYGVRIPTGLFEHWRMPVEVDSASLPFDVEVTGYVPYISRFDTSVADGGSELNPAVQFELALGKMSRKLSLVALSPAQSLGSFGVPIEFRWTADAGERERIFRPFEGPNELEITIKDAGITRRFAIQVGQTVQIEGTPYEIKVQDIRADWPMMTPGYEGALSPMASIDVSNGRQKYNRTVIQRFPELSQDIDEQNVRHREGPYDPNLETRFRTCQDGWITFVAGSGQTPEIGVFDPDGQLHRQPIEVGATKNVNIQGVDVALTVRGLYEKSRNLSVPVLEPLDTRRPNLSARSMSAVRLKFTGRGENAGWSETQWCAFSPYPQIEDRTIRIRPPGASTDWKVCYSRYVRKLDCSLLPGRLSVTYFPGKRSVETWWSDFSVVHPDGKIEKAKVYTNETYSTGNWTLFQSGAARDDWSFTVLGVGNRNGIWPMVLGCIFITLGCLYAFYVKPIILRRIAARGKSASMAKYEASPEPAPRKDPAWLQRELQDVH